ncbi:anaerobic ribonucleoside-triphosphate reductase activating protein [Candidatus Bathyarchaeota archaeon]|nr:anaerobic ribonucleoside-triphosphate reductase activating protein [Candidatus Bathyarchaeota archaeon]
MRIGGFQKLSLLDYPGKLSAIIFTLGCNFRCPFCYVPHLVLPEMMKKIEEIPVEYVLAYLKKRKRFLDAVVVSGGEATIHSDLPDLLKQIKSMGYLVALETNGSNNRMLRQLISDGLVDYIEMDLKAPLKFNKYNRAVGGVLTKETFKNIKESVKMLLASSIDYEFRTTLVKEIHTKEDILEICRSIEGAKKYYLQNFRRAGLYVGGKELTPFKEKEIKEILEAGRRFVNITYRG